jgi:hypothetical protein
MFIVMVVKPWSSIELPSLGGIKCSMSDNAENGMIGFVPVFETRAQAEKWADGHEVVEIRECER